MTSDIPNSPRQRIAVAVARSKGRYLVGVRPSGTDLAEFAEFPGGKCRDGEEPAAAAIRECLEETGIRVVVDRLLAVTRHDYDHGKLELLFFLCRPAQAGAEDLTGKLNQPSGGFRWVPGAELATLRFPPANEEVLLMLGVAIQKPA